ncbi:hypothetical protein ScPMuIL_001612 [Solemya velum]
MMKEIPGNLAKFCHTNDLSEIIENNVDNSTSSSPTRNMSCLTISPRRKQRSVSMKMKKPRKRCQDTLELDDIRPRTSSLPTRSTLKKPSLSSLRPRADSHNENDDEFYRLRNFITTAKGIVNRGDSIISRSTNSVLSSGSEFGALSRTSSSLSCHSSAANISTCFLTGTRVFRILVLGSTGVGKTALTQQFMTSDYLGGFNTSIDSVEEKTVTIALNGEESVLSFIDPQSENDSSIYGSVEGYVIVFSIDERTTFDSAIDILYNLRKDERKENAIILVGNKCDLVRTRNVMLEESRAVAKQYDCKFVETSTVLNHNVDELLVGIVTQIRLKIKHVEDEKQRETSDEKGCYSKGKALLNKILGKESLSKSCDNLYVL